MLGEITCFVVLAIYASHSSACSLEQVGTRVGHPTNCAAFFVCTRTLSAIPQECPSGLHFNQKLQVCDYPSRAGCAMESLSRASQCEGCDCSVCCSGCSTTPAPCEDEEYTIGTSPTPVITTPASTTLPVKAPCGDEESTTTVAITNPCEDDETTNGTSTSSATPNSPPEVSNTPPLEEETTTPHLNTPPEGTITPSASVTVPSPTTPESEIPTTVPPPIPPPSANCDAVCCDKPDGQTIPKEGDCQKFIVCQDERQIIMSCPNNLHFSIAEGQCDFPQQAKCPWPYVAPSGPSAGPSGTHCAVYGRCVGQPDGTAFPNASNACSLDYVVCQCECEVARSCSAPLMFNSENNVCDWPTNFGC